jgi:hypothetical protein
MINEKYVLAIDEYAYLIININNKNKINALTLTL